jgi:MFS family permease
MTATVTAPIDPGAERDPQAAGPRGAWFALIVLALLWPTQLLALAGMLNGNAQASVALHFKTTEIAWFILMTTLVGVLVTPFAVRAADMFGKRQVMITITVVGLIGDVIAALAPNYGTLLLGRAIAGFYGPIGALAYAAIRELFPPRKAATASSIVASGIAFVAIGGPFLTGWIIDGHGFRGALWTLATATFIGLLLLLFAVPETHARVPGARMDWVGGILLGGGLTVITYGLNKGAEWGWTSATTLAFVAGGLVALAAFVVAERRTSHPMVEISMLRRRPVWSVMLAAAFAGGAVYGATVIVQLLALYPDIPTMSDGLGMTATHYAVVGLPASILILITGFCTGLLVRKIDTRLPFALGCLLAATGFLVQAANHYTETQLIVGGSVFALGFGMIVATIPVLIIETVTPEEQAVASGLQNMTTGVAITLVTTVAYVLMDDHSAVVQGTRLYLDQGFKHALWFAAGTTILALVTVLLIPRLRPPSQPDDDPQTSP